ILLTAYFRESEHAVLGYDAGAVDYLTKPVHPAVLRSKVGVFIDLFRKNAELLASNQSLEAEIEQRKAAEERFRVVFEVSPTAKLVFDRDGKLSVANSQAERLFGRSRGELLGCELKDLIPAHAVPTHTTSTSDLESIGAPVNEVGREMSVMRDNVEIP